MSLSSIPRTLRMAVFERDQGRCRYCRLVQVGQAAAFHVDHVVPRSKNGATTIDNLALQCPHCSLHKSSRTGAPDPETRQSLPLFHPLIQVWHEHFALEQDGSIRGVSAVGRATADALHMNAPIIRTARAMQILLGII